MPGGSESFIAILDIEVVVFRRHHLRAGPHDDRGPCGCAQNLCQVVRHHSQGFAAISEKLRDEAGQRILGKAQAYANLEKKTCAWEAQVPRK